MTYIETTGKRLLEFIERVEENINRENQEARSVKDAAERLIPLRDLCKNYLTLATETSRISLSLEDYTFLHGWMSH